jgi:hypothetical protein
MMVEAVRNTTSDAVTLAGYIVGAAAFPVCTGRRFRHAGWYSERNAVHDAWDAHAKHGKLMTLKEIRATAARVLNGAMVRRHLLWRYSLVWRKP